MEVSRRIRAFVSSMEEKIDGLTDEAFATLVTGVKSTVGEKDTDIFVEALRYEEAINTKYLFDKSNSIIF